MFNVAPLKELRWLNALSPELPPFARDVSHPANARETARWSDAPPASFENPCRASFPASLFPSIAITKGDRYAAAHATVPGVFFVGGERAGTTLLYSHATAALGARLSPGERLVDASETAWNVKEKFFWGRDAGFGASSFAGGAAAKRKYLRHYAPCPSSVPWACPPGDATWCVRAYGSAPRQIARAYGPHLSTRVSRG